MAKIDAEAERGIRDKYGVQSYPTILVFPPAKFGVSEPKVHGRPVCCSAVVPGRWDVVMVVRTPPRAPTHMLVYMCFAV